MRHLGFAFRQLLKNPGFTAVVVLTLALGIGANTAIFSVLDGVLLQSLPYRDPNRLVWLYQNKPKREWLQWPMGTEKFKFWREHSRTFEQIGLAGPTDFHLIGDRSPELIRGLRVTANLCDLLGFQPALGRAFLAEENKPGAPDVVILSHRLWQQRFAGNAAIVGQRIRDRDRSYTIVGVLPPNLKFPIGPMPAWRLVSTGDPDIWLPARFRRTEEGDGDLGFAIGRLKAGVSLQQAQAEMTALSVKHEELNATEGWSVDLVPMRDQVSGHVRPALLLLMVAVGAVLLIACVNVANLLLARSIGRRKEFAIRTAIGASRFQLLRELLIESLLLSALGGLAGVLLAFWAIPALMALSPAHLPRMEDVRIDARVLSFTAGLSLLAGLLFGLVPAWQTARADLSKALHGGSPGSIGHAGRQGLRELLVTAEVALAFALLIGAGLLIRSFGQVLNVDTGYRPQRLLVMNLSLNSSKFPTDESKPAFVKDLIERIEALPGVAAAGFSFGLPLTRGVPISRVFKVDGAPPGNDSSPKLRLRIVSSNYFAAMGIRFVKGQNFSVQSRKGDIYEVLLNESGARSAFPGEDPIGKQCIYGPIVGIVADTLETGLDQPAGPQFYIEGYSASEAFLVVRTTTAPESVKASLMNEISAADKDLPVHNVKTMQTLVAESLAQRRFQVTLLAVFGASALLLTLIGIYGVVAFSVTQRTPEIGVRIALGAQASDVMKLIVSEGLKPVLIGVALGLIGAWAVTRILSSQLFGVTATDPLTFIIVCLILLGIAGIACWLPGRRATRIDPIKALRME
jgi:putative ABC transport system permease protein